MRLLKEEMEASNIVNETKVIISFGKNHSMWYRIWKILQWISTGETTFTTNPHYHEPRNNKRN